MHCTKGLLGMGLQHKMMQEKRASKLHRLRIRSFYFALLHLIRHASDLGALKRG